MTEEMVNTLKAKVKELKYADLKSTTWDEVISGKGTYKDLNRTPDILINGELINSEFIRGLYSKHENFITKDETGKNNYRPFLKKIFTEMFEHAGATIPNNSIIEELIDNYYQGGYIAFFPYHISKALRSFNSLYLQSNYQGYIKCNNPDYLKFTLSLEGSEIRSFEEGELMKVCDLYGSVEFKLKYKNGNVTYEDGKVSLTIPKELEDCRAGDDNLLDKLIDIVNKIIEYFKKLCEKLGFKFDTRIEYDSECNIKMEHSLGKPLAVLSDTNALHDKNLKLNSELNNSR